MFESARILTRPNALRVEILFGIHRKTLAPNQNYWEQYLVVVLGNITGDSSEQKQLHTGNKDVH